uniref:Alginate export domain-containing protein n=1 Tax=Candidatus Kentrum sp. TC TaxID=2126339 RepID=A0A450ZC40_9GAMM|nr:MAG: hypothetical protein BECKTC1821E_GA0114239_1001125 [Candidatus Kentron sp. TC]VFK43098.1 MAG: hypothetical protein BECKTC1821D_GA0114238_10157 [Candidatus Kentron sp. TC]VFK51349.1 MAG: hypothetical protein BECKTC1821F_GA0114240_100157 [Candidatus Kentron sp. TC]
MQRMLRRGHRFVPWALCLSILLSINDPGMAKTEILSGYLRLRPVLRSARDDTPNNPGAVLFDTTSRYVQAFGLLHANFDYRETRLFFQARPQCELRNGRSDCDIHLDEGYLDMEAAPSLFVSGGRRNIVNGVAHIANPTDFLGEEEEIDRTLDETERRELRKGTYLAGLEYFFDDGTSLSAIAAPRVKGLQDRKDRLQLKLALLYPEIDTDLEVIGLATADRPGIGVNLSHTFNDSTVLYTESALRRGRDRSVIVADAAGNRIVEGDRNKGYFDSVVGGRYTFDSGVNLILEYRYNGNGYGSGEWGTIQEFFETNTRGLSTPETIAKAIGNLGQGNREIIGVDSLRQRYLFSRLNYPQSWGDIDSSLILLNNLDDGSHLLRGRIEKDVTDRIRTGAMVEYRTGDSGDEFGLRPWNRAVTFDLKLFF